MKKKVINNEPVKNLKPSRIDRAHQALGYLIATIEDIRHFTDEHKKFSPDGNKIEFIEKIRSYTDGAFQYLAEKGYRQ